MEENDYDRHPIPDPYALLVITRKGELRKVNCPFRVLCTAPLKEVKYNSVCYVTKVIADDEYNSMYYRIGKYYFRHTFFRIYIAF